MLFCHALRKELKEGEAKELNGMLVARNDIRLREEGYDIIGENLNIDLKEEVGVKEEDFDCVMVLNSLVHCAVVEDGIPEEKIVAYCQNLPPSLLPLPLSQCLNSLR